MLRKPLSKAPSHCSLCELAHPNCDICPSQKHHCMKYHTEIIPFIRPCEWRDKAKPADIKQAIGFANNQLADYYTMKHNAKEKNLRRNTKGRHNKTVRGLTRRLTISPDFFRDQ